MPDVRSFFGGSKKPTTVVKGRRRIRVVEPKTIAKIAKRTMNRMVETKHAYQTLFTTWQPVYGSTLPSGGQAQLFNALFNVNQNDTAMGRSGNIIRPTTLYNDLQIILNDRTTDAGSSGTSLMYDAWDITVHVWYGVARRYAMTGDVISSAPTLLANMFDDQFTPGHQTSWNGKFTDQLNPVNKEAFVLKHKTVRLTKGLGINNTADSATSSLYTPAKTTATMRLKWKCPKQLRFNDLEGLPQDYAPFFVIGYCHNDTSQAANTVTGGGVLSKPALLLQASQHLFFKDA